MKFFSFLLSLLLVVGACAQKPLGALTKTVNPHDTSHVVLNTSRVVHMDTLGQRYRLGFHPLTVTNILPSGNSALLRNKLVRDTSSRVWHIDNRGVANQVGSTSTVVPTQPTIYTTNGTINDFERTITFANVNGIGTGGLRLSMPDNQVSTRLSPGVIQLTSPTSGMAFYQANSLSLNGGKVSLLSGSFSDQNSLHTLTLSNVSLQGRNLGNQQLTIQLPGEAQAGLGSVLTIDSVNGNWVRTKFSPASGANFYSQNGAITGDRVVTVEDYKGIYFNSSIGSARIFPYSGFQATVNGRTADLSYTGLDITNVYDNHGAALKSDGLTVLGTNLIDAYGIDTLGFWSGLINPTRLALPANKDMVFTLPDTIPASGFLRVATNGTMTVEQPSGGGASVQPPPTEANNTTSFSALLGVINQANSSTAALSVVPPLNPAIGDRFAVVDSRATSGTNNITINFTGSSQRLYGAVQNYILNFPGAYVEFIYMGVNTGWIATKG